jgi:hypothetical protein
MKAPSRATLSPRERAVFPKSKEEIAKPAPNPDHIRGWEREIDSARSKVRKLEERLEK